MWVSLKLVWRGTNYISLILDSFLGNPTLWVTFRSREVVLTAILLRFYFCSCWMVWHWTQNLCWGDCKSRLDTWKLDSCWDGLLCKWMEDAYTGSKFTIDSVHCCLVVWYFISYSINTILQEVDKVLRSQFTRLLNDDISGGYQSLQGGSSLMARSNLLMFTSWNVPKWIKNPNVWIPSPQG